MKETRALIDTSVLPSRRLSCRGCSSREGFSLAMFRGGPRWQLLILAIAAALLVPAAAQATPTFLSAINISDAGQDGFEPQVVADTSGRVTAVWTRSDGSNFRIQTSDRTAAGPWSAPQTIPDPGMSA